MERITITQNIKPGPSNLKRIVKAMQDLGVSQREAAEVCGVAQPNLCKFLQGSIGIKEQELRDLTEYLGLRMIARFEVDIYR